MSQTRSRWLGCSLAETVAVSGRPRHGLHLLLPGKQATTSLPTFSDVQSHLSRQTGAERDSRDRAERGDCGERVDEGSSGHLGAHGAPGLCSAVPWSWKSFGWFPSAFFEKAPERVPFKHRGPCVHYPAISFLKLLQPDSSGFPCCSGASRWIADWA